LTTLVAKLKVTAQNVLFFGVQVNFVCDVCSREECLRATSFTIETIGTLPVALRDLNKLRLQTPVMVNLITHRTNEKTFPLL
jgi:hypothetical protein